MVRRGLATTCLCIFAASGCSSECDQELIDEAVGFVNDHLQCATDDDCVVVHPNGCSELPGSFCGQLAMNREGAESEKWQFLQGELADCGPSECARCLGLLVPSCTQGSCGRPQ